MMRGPGQFSDQCNAPGSIIVLLMPLIRILIVDDHPIMRVGLAALLASSKEMEMVAEAGSGEEALEAIKKDKPSIVFLDITMKGMSGLEVLAKTKGIDKAIKVIMLTVHNEKEIVDRAKELGADEYITKPFRIDYLDEVVIKKVQELLKEKSYE